MSVPTTIKIRGQVVNVTTGKDYVSVGESSHRLNEADMERVKKIEKYEEHCRQWQELVYDAYQTALAKERRRLKS